MHRAALGVTADGGTSELHANAALTAGVAHLASSRILHTLEKRAGTLCDDDRDVVSRTLLAYDLLKPLNVKGIRHRDVLDAESRTELDEIIVC